MKCYGQGLIAQVFCETVFGTVLVPGTGVQPYILVMPDFQDHCTVRPGLSGQGTTRATRVCRSLGGVDLRQFGPPDRHVRIPDRVLGSMSQQKLPCGLRS